MDFEKQSYWRDRFAREESFEWLVTSSDLMAILDPLLASQSLGPDAHICHLGFGTSDLQNHFRARGFSAITNLDYEPLACERGRALEVARFGDSRMEFRVADVTQLPADLGAFDLVVDKSTVDAVACGGDDMVRRMGKGVERCLKPGAVWVSLSYSSARFSDERLPFDVEVLHKFPVPKMSPTEPDVFHWCYLLRPPAPAARLGKGELEGTDQVSGEMCGKPVITKVSDLATADARWVTLKKVDYVDQVGKSRSWEVATRKTTSKAGIDAVAMGNILLHPSKPASTMLVIQYRPPLDSYTVEWPAGLVDADETAEQAAVREFKEETGYECKVLSVSPPQAADPGMTNASMQMVMVEVQLKEDEPEPEQRLDDGEHIQRVVVPLAELYEKLVEYSKQDRMIVAAKLFHFAAGMNFMKTQKYF
ncbi:hypothetical protein BN1708_012059 [Verticillium longisporum]|uniref:Nudix hydrolase domain-containing protein n=1 Tax=Verticillium longisporum TaxID=100787 RepID=A0A0G4L656_VERLO|nr:hypothetical protein BN1708_012059 [Verticillium longisporum]